MLAKGKGPPRVGRGPSAVDLGGKGMASPPGATTFGLRKAEDDEDSTSSDTMTPLGPATGTAASAADDVELLEDSVEHIDDGERDDVLGTDVPDSVLSLLGRRITS